MGLVEEGREESGEHVEGCADAVEGGEQHDAREEEGDLPRPGALIECGEHVFGEQGEDPVDGVCGGRCERRGVR